MKNNLTIDLRMVNYSGIGTYLRNLIPLVINQLPEVRINILGCKEDLSEYESLNNRRLELIEFSPKLYSLKEQFGYLKTVPKYTDVFWTPHYNAPIASPGKLLVTIHDLIPLIFKDYQKGIINKLFIHKYFNYICKKASAIIAVSDFTKNEILRILNVNSSKITVIKNGINPKWFAIKPTKNPHSNPYFLFVGNVKPHKNLNYLTRAFTKLAEMIPHDLVIVGKRDGFINSETFAFHEYIEKRGRIHFTGWVNEEELEQYYLHSEALIIPSLYEGFGLPLLEGMACGTPVIAADIPPFKEIGAGAFISFNPQAEDDLIVKIIEFLENPKIKDDLKSKGISCAKSYSWEKTATETAGVINQLLKK